MGDETWYHKEYAKLAEVSWPNGEGFGFAFRLLFFIAEMLVVLMEDRDK
jgi:hypothetical protein